VLLKSALWMRMYLSPNSDQALAQSFSADS